MMRRPGRRTEGITSSSFRNKRRSFPENACLGEGKGRSTEGAMKTTHGAKAGVILWIAVFLLSCAATEDVRILDQESRQNASQLNKLQKDMETLQGDLSSLQKESKQAREAMSKEGSASRADLLLRIENLESEMRMLTAGVEEYKDFAKKPSKEIDRLKEDLAFRTKILEEKNKTLEERARAFEESDKEMETRLKAMEDHAKQLDNRLEQIASQSSEPEQPSAERASPTSASNLYRDAYETLQKGDMEGTRRKFEAFLKQYPNTELSDNAQFWIGETYYQKKDYEKAILEYEKVIVTYPEGEKVSSALLKQALAFLELGDKTNARNLLKRVIDRYPQSDQAEMAKKRLETLQ
jgi:tol-pal system protein YbgF